MILTLIGYQLHDGILALPAVEESLNIVVL